MNQNEIEKAIAFAHGKNWTPSQLGIWLTGAPHHLTPAEATRIMDTFRRSHPTNPAPAARLRKAKATPTAIVAAEGGELLTVSAARPSIINRSTVKAFALKVSKEKRAGKFERVSKEFLDSVEANLEALIRDISSGYTKHEGVAPDPECDWFINGRTLRCAEEKLNEAVQKIVLAKVHSHPTIGKTLK